MDPLPLGGPSRTATMTHDLLAQPLRYDFHKHFTTLGTGSVLFIAALVKVIWTCPGPVGTFSSRSILFYQFNLLELSRT